MQLRSSRSARLWCARCATPAPLAPLACGVNFVQPQCTRSARVWGARCAAPVGSLRSPLPPLRCVCSRRGVRPCPPAVPSPPPSLHYLVCSSQGGMASPRPPVKIFYAPPAYGDPPLQPISPIVENLHVKIPTLLAEPYTLLISSMHIVIYLLG